MYCPGCNFKLNRFIYSDLCYVHSLRFVQLEKELLFVGAYNKLIRENKNKALCTSILNRVYAISVHENKNWDLNSYVDPSALIGLDETSQKFLIVDNGSAHTVVKMYKVSDCYIIVSDRVFVVPVSIPIKKIKINE